MIHTQYFVQIQGKFSPPRDFQWSLKKYISMIVIAINITNVTNFISLTILTKPFSKSHPLIPKRLVNGLNGAIAVLLPSLFSARSRLLFYKGNLGKRSELAT